MSFDLKKREQAFDFIGSERYNKLIYNVLPEKLKGHLIETGESFMYKSDLYFLSQDEIILLFDSIFLSDMITTNESIPFENICIVLNGMRFEKVIDIGVSYSIELI